MEDLISYSRQEAMDEVLSVNKNTTQIIIGCGGIGFWLGIMLAMNGYTKFVLIDADNLEPTNLNRIPCPPAWIGTNKAIALRKIISILRPETAITVITKKFNVDTEKFFEGLINKLNNVYVWDTTDNAVDQKVIYKVIKDLTTNYSKLGYEGFKVGAYNNYSIWTAEGYTPGYRTTMANSCSSALAAIMGYFSKNETKDVVFDAMDFIKEMTK